MKYFEEWKDSWLTLFNNLKLLVPDVILLIANILIAGLILWVSGLFPIVKTIYVDKNFDVISNSLARVIIAGTIFIVTSFILGSSVRGVKYNYVKDVIKKKKVDLSKFFKYGEEFVSKIIFARIYLYLIGLVIAVVIGALSLVSKISLVLIPIVGLIYVLGMMFIFPIMFLKNKSAFESVKLSFIYFKENIWHVVAVWVMITFTSVGISVLGNMIKIPFFSPILNVVTSLFIGVWSTIYLFKGL